MWNDSLTRRKFLKRSGTASAATILAWHGMGTKSWAETTGGGTGGSSGVTAELKMEYQWGLYVVSHPKDANGDPKLSDSSIIPILDTITNAHVADLSINVESVQNPHHSLTVTSGDLQNGIPANKIKFTIPFQQKGKTFYDGDKEDFLHPNDAHIPETGYASTPAVDITLKYLVKTVGPWKEGEAQPDPPPSPDITDNPDADTAKNINPTGGNLGLLGEWSNYGWSWIAAYENEAEFEWTIGDVVGWNPDDDEGKTTTISLIWALNRAKRSRTMKKKPGEDWKPVADGGNADGWSKWMPD